MRIPFAKLEKSKRLLLAANLRRPRPSKRYYGMALVEEAAAYLDGPGREQSRLLPRLSALTYANESMRLTTRLMQMASWLLVQRSIAEGEMSADDGVVQLGKMRVHRNDPPLSAEHVSTLPEALIELIDKS